jgi:hypothetical protein
MDEPRGDEVVVAAEEHPERTLAAICVAEVEAHALGVVTSRGIRRR